MKIYKLILISLVITTLVGVGVNIVKAENGSEVIITWEADNFYPSNYQGKPKATPNSKINVSATVLENNKIKDYSNLNFFWYNNNNLIKRGAGENKINFEINKQVGEEYFIKLRIEEGEKVLEKSIKIPISSYEIVVDYPSPNKSINLGEEKTIRSIPYFLNVNNLNDLNFVWKVINAKEYVERGNILNLKIGNSKSLINTKTIVTGWVSNLNNPMESAKTNLRLEIND